MADLLELAERCEKATGPLAYGDHLEIFEALHGKQPTPATGGTNRTPWGAIPAYTASLDAAMTLVPESHAFNLDNGPCHWICLGKQKPMGRADVRYPKPDYNGEGDSWLTVSAIAATPALALCAAALRAREVTHEPR